MNKYKSFNAMCSVASLRFIRKRLAEVGRSSLWYAEWRMAAKAAICEAMRKREKRRLGV